MAKQSDPIARVVEMMSTAGISQLPVTDDNGWIKGIIREETLLRAVFRQKASGEESISTLVDTSVEFVSPSRQRRSSLAPDRRRPCTAGRGSGGRWKDACHHYPYRPAQLPRARRD
jgi:CBS domain-containing protein